MWENSLSKGRAFDNIWENLAKISLPKGRVPEIRFAHTRQYSTNVPFRKYSL